MLSELSGPVEGLYTAILTASELVYPHQGQWFEVSNATYSLSGSGTAFTVTLTPTSDGEIRLRAAEHGFMDAAGNRNPPSNEVSITQDTTPPQVASITRSSPTTSPTDADQVSWAVTYDEPVTGVAASDFELTGSTAVLAVSGSGANYSVTASGGNLATYDGTVTLNHVASPSIEDLAGNALVDTTPVGENTNFFVIANPPEVTLEPITGPVDGIYSSVVSMSEDVTGFTVDGLDLVNTTAAISGSGSSYTLSLTPVAAGLFSVQVASNSVEDAAGNRNVAPSNLVSAIGVPPLELNLSTNTAALTRGAAMTAVTATATGGDEDYTFTIAPALPAGLGNDADTGTISGTPTEASATTSYTITVTDGDDTTATASLSLGVDHPGLDLALSEASVSLTRGVAMTAVTATADGGDEDYTFTIDPALPAGLSFDADGTISGTPTEASATTSYTITVTDGDDTTATASVSLGVDHPALDLALSETSVSLTRGAAMTAVTATATGGDEDYTFTIAPALPAGLSIDADTGAISGTPTEASATTSYTITVTDGDDTTATASLSLGVDHPGLDLALSEASVSLTRGVAMTAVTATADGGDEDYTFTIDPALPAGLSFDADTGAISGTPTEASATTSYTITVTDGTGTSQTAALNLTVNQPVLGLSLSDSSVTLTRGVTMAAISATATGGDEDYSFTVTPALPTGLSINAATGTISGTPSMVASTAVHTVRATDGGGTTATATLSVSVIEDEERVIEAFTEATSLFIANRMEQILSAEPRGYRFDNRRSTGMNEVTGRGDDDAAMFRFAGSHVSPDNAWHIWVEGEYSSYRHRAVTGPAHRGQFGMISAGGITC